MEKRSQQIAVVYSFTPNWPFSHVKFMKSIISIISNWPHVRDARDELDTVPSNWIVGTHTKLPTGRVES